MALPARWVEPEGLARLRSLAHDGNTVALRALRQWTIYRMAPRGVEGARTRRAARRAYIRLADKATGVGER